jgi:spore coat-associated protein N
MTRMGWALQDMGWALRELGWALRDSRRFQLLTALALLAVAVAVTAFSGAVFSAKSKNNGTSLSAGSTGVANSKGGSAIVSASGMSPGVSRNGTLTITNGGNVSENVNLKSTGLTDTPSSPALSATIDLTIEDTTGTPTTLYSGKLGSFSSNSLGTFAVNETRSYKFTLSWPSSGTDPALQAASTSLTFVWEATT